METATEKQRPAHGQVISVAHKDTVRLLEVYVKRSLSLNDGSLGAKKAGKKEKWVTLSKRYRRSSSDPSLLLNEALNHGESSVLPVAEPQMNKPMKDPEESEEPVMKTKKTKKIKKPSFWKTFLGIFKNEDKEEDQDSPSEVFDNSNQSTNCLPTTQISSQKKSFGKKSLGRKLSKRWSLRSIKFGKDVNSTDSTGVEAVIGVEPTYAYYEKVSEELEKIVHEVKEQEETEILSNEEIIKRIVALTIQEGDAIDGKLKDNPMLSSFLQRMTYSSFQKMADAYVEKEAKPTHKPTVPPTAPELVKLAFTLDFTARVAGLSKQNVGHITCLGYRYLQDRFEYRQACTDHPWSDSNDVDSVPLTGK